MFLNSLIALYRNVYLDFLNLNCASLDTSVLAAHVARRRKGPKFGDLLCLCEITHTLFMCFDKEINVSYLVWGMHCLKSCQLCVLYLLSFPF